MKFTYKGSEYSLGFRHHYEETHVVTLTHRELITQKPRVTSSGQVEYEMYSQPLPAEEEEYLHNKMPVVTECYLKRIMGYDEDDNPKYEVVGQSVAWKCEDDKPNKEEARVAALNKLKPQVDIHLFNAAYDAYDPAARAYRKQQKIKEKADLRKEERAKRAKQDN